MRTVFLSLIFSLLLPVSLLAYNGNSKLCWDQNTEPDLGGYRVYVGSESGLTTGVFNPDVINAREAVITIQPDNTVCDESFSKYGIADGVYYAIVRAYDTSGNESGNSNEVAIDPLDQTPPANPGNAHIK